MCQVVTSTLFYDETTVIANASWDSALEQTFRVSYRARFENASLIYNGSGVTVVTNNGDRYEAQLDGEDYMVAELRYFCDTVLGRIENTLNTASSAAASVKLIESIKESAMSGGAKIAVKRNVGEWSNYL